MRWHRRSLAFFLDLTSEISRQPNPSPSVHPGALVVLWSKSHFSVLVTACLDCKTFLCLKFSFSLSVRCSALIRIWASGHYEQNQGSNSTKWQTPSVTKTSRFTCCCSLSSDLIASIKLRVNVCSSKYFCLWFSNSFSMNRTSSFCGGKWHEVLEIINSAASL